MKENGILNKLTKLFTLEDQGTLINESNGIEMENKTKVLVYNQYTKDEKVQIVYYDRADGVLYDINNDESLTEQDLASNNITVKNFYLGNFNKREQTNIIRTYEFFKKNHSILFENSELKNYGLDEKIDKMLEKLIVVSIGKRTELRDIEFLTLHNLELARMLDDCDFMQALEIHNRSVGDTMNFYKEYDKSSHDLLTRQSNLIVSQVVCYYDEILDRAYLLDESQAEQMHQKSVAIDLEDVSYDEEYAVQPYSKKNFVRKQNMSEADIMYLYHSYENIFFNNLELVKTKNKQKIKQFER